MKKIILVMAMALIGILVLSGCETKSRTVNFDNQNNCVSDVAVLENQGWSCESCVSNENQNLFDSGATVRIGCTRQGSIFSD